MTPRERWLAVLSRHEPDRVDNQYTLAFGSVDELRQEVLDNLRIFGEDGGYIIAPCHNIQAVSPPENVIAMYDAGYEYGQA